MNVQGIAAGVTVAVFAGLGCTAAPAQAVTFKGKVDVCTVDLGKSWTKGLSKKANKAFKQRVKVHRLTEDQGLPRYCDVMIWQSGGTEERPGVAVNPETNEVTNPKYFVYTGPYAMTKAEINVGPKAVKRSERPSTIVQALRAAGVR